MQQKTLTRKRGEWISPRLLSPEHQVSELYSLVQLVSEPQHQKLEGSPFSASSPPEIDENVKCHSCLRPSPRSQVVLQHPCFCSLSSIKNGGFKRGVNRMYLPSVSVSCRGFRLDSSSEISRYLSVFRRMCGVWFVGWIYSSCGRVIAVLAPQRGCLIG
jgi:hypothetical protein